MAEDKKSFVLYTDIIHTVRKMPKDKAADLFLTILAYVNDEDPIVEDMVVDLVFEPIKRQLKRDLVKYDEKKKILSKSGREGGLKSAELRKASIKPIQATLEEAQAFQPVTDNVTVNDTVIVTVNANDKQIQGLCSEIMKLFKFSEMNHPAKLFEISAFLNKINKAGRLDFFAKEFPFYVKYKSESGEKLHSFPSFLDKGWSQENWEGKYNEFKKQNKNGNGFSKKGGAHTDAELADGLQKRFNQQ